MVKMERKKILKCIGVLALFALCFGAGQTVAQFQTVRVSTINQMPKGYLAIVIDDFGYDGEGTEEMLALEVPLTAAVMPFSEHSKEDVKMALDAGKEVMIHMPMESLTGKASWVGDKGVFRNMEEEDIKNAVREACEIVTGAVALNNHMGSAIMEDKRCLSAVMDVVKEKNLYFVDSMTTPNSVAAEVTNEKEVPLLKRNVFLDSTNDIEMVKKKLRQAGEIALQDGFSLAIGL